MSDVDNNATAESIGNVAQIGNLHGDLHFHSSPGVPASLDAILNARGRIHLSSTDPIRTKRRVALWGPPGAGKTCFLAAINAAVAQAADGRLLAATTNLRDSWRSARRS